MKGCIHMRKLSLLALLGIFFYYPCFAGPGLFFNVSLNNNNKLTITTTPNHLYTAAGIKITSSGYSLKNPGTDCTMASNGYCLFRVSNTQPATISLQGSSGS